MCAFVIKKKPSHRYYPSVKCFQSVLWNNTIVDSWAAVKNGWENGTKQPSLRVEICCKQDCRYKQFINYLYVKIRWRTEWCFFHNIGFFMMSVDKNVGLVAGTRGSIIPRKKANIHQLAFPFISMAASQLVQDLPEVHCHKVFFFWPITRAVNAMWLITLKLADGTTRTYTDLNPSLGTILIYDVKPRKCPEERTSWSALVFCSDRQLCVSLCLNIFTVITFFDLHGRYKK